MNGSLEEEEEKGDDDDAIRQYEEQRREEEKEEEDEQEVCYGVGGDVFIYNQNEWAHPVFFFQ